MYSRWCKRRSAEISDTSSHPNERYLNTPEKKEKMSKLREKAQKENKKLRSRIHELSTKEGTPIDTDFQQDLLAIMEDNQDAVKKAYPESSFARLFWEEQLKVAKVADARQRRWRPKKWYLNL